MKNKKIMWIIAVVVVLAIIISVVVIITNNNKNNKNNNNNDVLENVRTDENGNKINISNKMKEEKNYEGCVVKNAMLKTDGGNTTFTAQILNNTSSKLSNHLAKVVFLDKDGNDISEIGFYLKEILAGNEIKINTSISGDLTNAVDYRIMRK